RIALVTFRALRPSRALGSGRARRARVACFTLIALEPRRALSTGPARIALRAGWASRAVGAGLALRTGRTGGAGRGGLLPCQNFAACRRRSARQVSMTERTITRGRLIPGGDAAR